MKNIFKTILSTSLILSIIISNILFLLPSETLALVVNSSAPPPVSTNPPPTNTINVTSTPSNNSYGNGIITSVIPTYTNDRWSEDTLDRQFNQYGVDLGGGVRLYGLGNFAVTGAVALKKTVDYYTNAVRGSNVSLSNLTVRAGTDTYPADQPVLDINSDSNLDYFINHLATSRGNTSYGELYQLGDDYFFKNNHYWHIIFGPSNGAFVKNNINFFGVVRDNFTVNHPTITDTNTPSIISFPRNLTVGYSGKDVHDLQQLLNTDPYTVVAVSGIGSPGHETNYFGAKTKNAVERYQYKDNEILDAAAITTPTGFFGTFSRASITSYGNYLNAMKNNQNRDTLRFPSPTKPLEDIPLNGAVPGNNNSGGTPIVSITNTPNAPPYTFNYTNGTPDPYAYNYPTSTDPIYLNNTPVFDYPNYNGIQDPNISGNQTPNSSQSSPLSSITSLLPTALTVLMLLRNQGFTLPGLGGAHAPGANGVPHATGAPDFGGTVDYNSRFDQQNNYRPCGAPTNQQGAYLMMDDNSAFPAGQHPIYLVGNLTTDIVGGGTAVVGACIVGKYNPGIRPALMGCKTLIKVPNGQDYTVDGAGPIFDPLVSGSPSIMEIKPGAACH